MMSDENNIWVREHLADTRSIEELLRVARTRYEDMPEDLDEPTHPGWYAVQTLHVRANQEIFDAASRLTVSNDPQDRALAADILGELGYPRTVFVEERRRVLIHFLENETDEFVLSCALVALGHMHDTHAVPALIKLKNHPSDQVRYDLAFSLWSLDDDDAIQTLIDLSSDADEDVRDWAIFGLGLSDRDSPEIRNAFLRRLEDQNEQEDTYYEALTGLAKRHDNRAVYYVQKAMRNNIGGRDIFEAAQNLADAHLLPDLLRLQAEFGDKIKPGDGLEEAISACRGDSLE